MPTWINAQGFMYQGDCLPGDQAATAEQIAAGQPPTVAGAVSAIQAALDAAAKAHGYDNIVSACSYAAQATGAPFQAEGAAFLAWRSAVWTQAYAVLAQVTAGTVPLMTPAQAVAAMPPFVDPSP